MACHFPELGGHTVTAGKGTSCMLLKLTEIIGQWLLSVALKKIIAALKSHMTCYDLNLNSFFTNCLKGFLYSKVQLNNLSSKLVMN